MLDIRRIRETPDAVKAALARRNPDLPAQIDAVISCDAERRQVETHLQNLQSERNKFSKQIGGLKAKGEDSSAIEAQVKSFSNEMEALRVRASELDAKQSALLLEIPNTPGDEVPTGTDAESNPVIRTWGEKPNIPNAEDHTTIVARLGLIDFERAAKISGSGFACYTGKGARLERALLNFLLDLHTDKHGYSEVSPPYLIRRECMIGTGQLPKFEDDMYGTDDGALFLAPTAEVPVTNLRREEILNLEELPVKLAAYTPCFRREAGSAGRDTRGLIRLHQFDKIELVKMCAPENSAAELELLTADAEKVLQLLGLHYRVIELCTGDIGFSSAKTYDIEVWSPGQQTYLEVSSCSNFGDYQARRMNLRFKNAEGKNQFCHTLNGSGTALARLYVAVVESSLQPDGSLRLPEALHSYFGSATI